MAREERMLALMWNFLWWPQDGQWYAFWSSFGGDLAYLGIFVVLYRKINCHTQGCWRIGHHRIDGTPFTVCRKHHPDI